MSLADWVAHYGYFAVAVGCLLEGETVLLLAGVAVHRGLLDLPAVAAVAFVAGFAGDQAWFFVGRRFGDRLIRRFAAVQRAVPRIQDLILRHQNLLVLGIRFMIGLRIAGPVLMGWSRVQALRFVLLNLLGAALWVAVIGGGGYYFSALMERLLPDLRRAEEGLLAATAAAGLVAHGVRLWRGRAARGRNKVY
ncbi:MAG TPA: DedA family protein [Zoogloea sp.]|uniref:DedA family protein n=1 Tax=Zoogloea sp. TaxID=49181 RepID=UPI002C88C3D1|nr:DedA family protein [Zoogloea sp.]HMV18691.1 DedA family protein [Rhodocyclaceae bacterium]HMV64841.1 DedA family protein [Rhodocyclaceae bacterium]HMW50867.1 DedA family protein [Rhodocyclaceae bacterium]HMY48338.1 DedA family protein [Rhodocyclaceae bacterium]HMZ75279.1 DedA family protein [Rhodocyclaceae bacterium]